MNLVDNDHLVKKSEKVQPAISLIREILGSNRANHIDKPSFIIPCSQYFWLEDDFSNSLKKQLFMTCGIEDEFCVSKPPNDKSSVKTMKNFNFELIKRIFLAAERMFSNN